MDRVRAGSFDIVHCNALHPLPLGLAASLGAPMVVVLHTPPFEPFAAAVDARGDATGFVAVSSALAAQWPSRDDLAVIENGVDLSRFQFGPVADVDRFAFWFGRIVPENGIAPRHRRRARRRYAVAHRRSDDRPGLLGRRNRPAPR